MAELLNISNLSASINGKEILKGVNLKIQKGEVHAIMGKNGSGKSTLSNVLMGHPSYKVTSGDIFLNGESILSLSVDERARKGIFLSFQYPTSISGVTVVNFLRTILKSIRGKDIPVKEFRKELKEKMGLLQIDEAFITRYVNEGFSGGEKKRHEILQMNLMNPIFAILDETDSGLDIDALKIVCEGINKFHTKENAILLITHYQRMLSYVVPDYIHIFIDGKIVRTGGKELAMELEEKGYEHVLGDFVNTKESQN
ncbi:MAG: Fe-S cluster assembly ATPase SufC [Leptospiraceae bacterium]|nr:Fe-S cluster assembly ATPase SufC [Leptospiraceae bacterium]MCK6381239.1 Fe-S cluster assembly ATPase SufC [Leptospiraceae bacterium]NUM41871.1 Fe-S cluster assembly ATPase SufC [Leptospiraceae bacterium]